MVQIMFQKSYLYEGLVLYDEVSILVCGNTVCVLPWISQRVKTSLISS